MQGTLWNLMDMIRPAAEMIPAVFSMARQTEALERQCGRGRYTRFGRKIYKKIYKIRQVRG